MTTSSGHGAQGDLTQKDMKMGESLSQRIQKNMPSLSKAERSIANYLITNPEVLMVETNASLASKVGVSTMTVSRFVRKIGFRDFSEAKSSEQSRVFASALPEEGSIGQRLERYSQADPLEEWADQNLQLEIAAIKQVHGLRNNVKWHQCVDLLTTSEAIYMTSFQIIRHIAIGFTAMLENVRPRVTYLDGQDEAYGGLFTDPAAKKTLVIVDTYPYSAQAVTLAKLSVDAGVELIVICDESCHWAIKYSQNVLSVTTNTGLIFRSKGALSILTSLLTHDVAAKLGPQARDTIETITVASAHFVRTVR